MKKNEKKYLFRVSAIDKCNYDCIFCHPQKRDTEDMLSDEEFMKIFKKVNELYPLKALHFTGGGAVA